MDNNDDFTKLRYVIYVRKSTDDPKRQARSIPDQIDECRQLADRMHLKVVGQPIIEKKSAKKPGRRPLFRKMLNDLLQGKIDGIIAWHPDRLSRNMKEGGEIIDMVDEGHIKDMKFVMHHFSSDANGKMLLGMAFVLSKQYSDKLSDDVTRGVRRSHEQGKSPAPKHGYIRDENGMYRPDGKNFDLICQAWQMRKEAVSLEDIVEYMNTNGYSRLVKSTGEVTKMTKQKLSDIFRDPFYYGILIQAGSQADLREIYDFSPAITEQDYLEVQALSGRRVNPYKSKRHTYLPLRMMVNCQSCGMHMYAGVSKGHTKKYLFYRCGNKFCKRKKKSVRAKIVFDFIYDFLSEGLNFTEADYNKYYGSLTKITDAKREKFQFELYSKQALLKDTRGKSKDLALKLLDNPSLSEITVKIGNDKQTELQQLEQQLEVDIEKLKQNMTNPEQDRLSIQQFLNLSKNAGSIIKSGDVIVKDSISRIIFLNFDVDEDKVASYRLKPPFDELLKTRSVLSSRGERN